jgi:photosystem II stability/assembly factor-like uncharacterized protein
MRRRIRHLSSVSPLLVLTIALGAPSRARAAAEAPPVWTRTGPDGGVAIALAAAPSRTATVYAGLISGGAFRSLDGGATWAYAGSRLGRQNGVGSLAVDAAQPDTVYAGTDKGLYKTRDGGGSWSRVNVGVAHGVTAVAADPQRSGVVFAAFGDAGIFTTANAGRSWKRLSGAPSGSVRVLAIDPVDTATLYAGTGAPGLFKSSDGGVHWKAVGRGLLSRTLAIALDPRHPQTLFLSSGDGTLYRSEDGGRTLQRSGSGLETMQLVTSLAVDPASSSFVFAATAQNGVYRSADGGHTWHPAGAGLPSRLAHVLLATRGALFAGTSAGVAQSRDRAATWQTGRGLSASSIRSLAGDRQTPQRLYAFELSGALFTSSSRGASWQRLPRSVEPGTRAPVGPVVVNPADPLQLQLELGLEGAVARSTDGGNHWSKLFDVGCVEPSRITTDPDDPDVVYASGGFAVNLCGLEPGTCSSYKYDHGETTCLSDPVIGPNGMAVLAVEPGVHQHLFASPGSGLYHSYDFGASWSLLSSAITPLEVIFDPVELGTLYATVLPKGVARSTVDGSIWHIWTAGLPPNAILSLVIDPSHPSTLYATDGLAVYRSTNSGVTWAPFSTGLGEVTVSQLVLDPRSPQVLYAGTYGGGVMALHLGNN